jgi:hypothetical protein
LLNRPPKKCRCCRAICTFSHHVVLISSEHVATLREISRRLAPPSAGLIDSGRLLGHEVWRQIAKYKRLDHLLDASVVVGKALRYEVVTQIWLPCELFDLFCVVYESNI